MATIQKTKSGHYVKLTKPIQFHLRGHPNARMFTKHGFTKYIHELSFEEIKQIKEAEKKLTGPLTAADRKLELDFELKSPISSQRTTDGEPSDNDEGLCEEAKAPAMVIFLTVPQPAVKKLRSKSVNKINIRASIRGMNLTTSTIHGNWAYPEIYCEFDVTESEETELDLEDPEVDE